MKTLSRRRVIVILAAASAVVLVGVPLARLGKRGKAIRRAILPKDREPGPLSEDTARSLVSAATALLGEPLEVSHYGGFFRWRAENLPGYRGLYERFAAAGGEAAARVHGRDFSACTPSQRSVLLESIAPLSGFAPWWNKVRVRSGQSVASGFLFQEFLVAEVLELFSRTDALVRLGYEDWPGVPRGLSRYQFPPADRLS